MKSIIQVVAGVIFIVGLLASARIVGQGANITGDWTFAVQTDMGAGTPAITFKQDGEKLTGKYNGQLGAADLTGTVKGNDVKFTFTIDVQGQQAPVSYAGTVEKNTMKGTLDIGGMATGTFTATKK